MLPSYAARAFDDALSLAADLAKPGDGSRSATYISMEASLSSEVPSTCLRAVLNLWVTMRSELKSDLPVKIERVKADNELVAIAASFAGIVLPR